MYFAFIILDLPEDQYPPSSPSDYSDVEAWASIATAPVTAPTSSSEDTSKGSDYLCLDF